MLCATWGLPLMRGMAYSLWKKLPSPLPMGRDGGCVGLSLCVWSKPTLPLPAPPMMLPVCSASTLGMAYSLWKELPQPSPGEDGGVFGRSLCMQSKPTLPLPALPTMLPVCR